MIFRQKVRRKDMKGFWIANVMQNITTTEYWSGLPV